MSFIVMDPDPFKRVEQAIEDVRAGRMVILVDDEDRENEGDLTMAAAAVTPEAINFMATHGRGLICLTLTEERVRQLALPMMAANNQSPYHTAFTVSIEAREGVSTGISASDRAVTIRAAIDPSKGPHDLVTPGHVFPLRARDGGVLVRTGQTEGSVDLARLAGLPPAGVICEIMNDDGSMARLPDLLQFGVKHGIRVVAVADLIKYRLRHETLVERLFETPAQVRGLEGFTVRGYRSVTDGSIHLALWKGDLTAGPPALARVQTACPVGDALGIPTCDCGSQLDAALARIHEEGRGILLYLYVGQGGDSLASRLAQHLGVASPTHGEPVPGDLREMGMGAQALLDLGVRRIRLMTNNPRKIVGLEGYGLEVAERVPLAVPASATNARFLEAQRSVLGHLLPGVRPADAPPRG
jgi:3,4-dihydroxy 2-butanone 4-phosphate synthase/GTP cyclohydrolase II